MTNPDIVESELVVTFMEEDNRPECMTESCSNEALWRALLQGCTCYHVYCNPCREYTDRFEDSNPFYLKRCRLCMAVDPSRIKWERI